MTDDLVTLLTGHYRDWFATITADGTGPLPTLLADDWVYTNYDGDVRRKDAYLDWMAGVNEDVEFVGPYDVEVVYRNGVAVVIGGYRVTHGAGGDDLELRFTGIWRPKGSDWECILHHNSEVKS